MKDTYEFINLLFEKSRILNDFNTKYLQDIPFGELSVEQKVDLFYKNTQYHEHILSLIKDIIRDLDKTEVLLSKEQQDLIHDFSDLDSFSQQKLLKISKALGNSIFIPKYLSTCPICGGRINSYRDNNKACKRVPLYIGKEILGYTLHCIKNTEENGVINECK